MTISPLITEMPIPPLPVYPLLPLPLLTIIPASPNVLLSNPLSFLFTPVHIPLPPHRVSHDFLCTPLGSLIVYIITLNTLMNVWLPFLLNNQCPKSKSRGNMARIESVTQEPGISGPLGPSCVLKRRVGRQFFWGLLSVKLCPIIQTVLNNTFFLGARHLLENP